jgi:hypothetical protein
MPDYFDVVTDLMGDGYSAAEAEMYAGNGIQPEPDDDEDQGCICPLSQSDCTC